MNRFFSATLLSGLLLAATLPVAAADAAKGKQLHDANCVRCHDSGVYTRVDRRIQSMESLHAQVARCEMTLDLQWFDEDRENVAEYLNDAFYKFQ
jgi:mono/diheme cytochrome c family protein